MDKASYFKSKDTLYKFYPYKRMDKLSGSFGKVFAIQHIVDDDYCVGGFSAYICLQIEPNNGHIPALFLIENSAAVYKAYYCTNFY